jgi:polyribonucleotide nucleotidyltransferase
VLEEALEQARQGRLHILGEMMKTMSEPRSELKPHVPRLEQIVIDKELIGAVIGPGGKIIQEIQKTTNTTITITEVGDKGLVDVFAVNKADIEAAIERIKAIVAVPEVGQVYRGKVVSVLDFGAFVEILPGKDGLLHVSEISYERVDRVDDLFKEGDEIDVKLVEVEKSGKLRLSIRAMTDAPDGWIEPERRPRPDRRSSDRDRRGGDRRGGDRDRDRRGGDRGGRSRDRGEYNRR